MRIGRVIDSQRMADLVQASVLDVTISQVHGPNLNLSFFKHGKIVPVTLANGQACFAAAIVASELLLSTYPRTDNVGSLTLVCQFPGHFSFRRSRPIVERLNQVCSVLFVISLNIRTIFDENFEWEMIRAPGRNS